jgi:hypothetical protein
MARSLNPDAELKSALKRWQNAMDHDKWLMSPSDIYLVGLTVNLLKELQQRLITMGLNLTSK